MTRECTVLTRNYCNINLSHYCSPLTYSSCICFANIMRVYHVVCVYLHNETFGSCLRTVCKLLMHCDDDLSASTLPKPSLLFCYIKNPLVTFWLLKKGTPPTMYFAFTPLNFVTSSQSVRSFDGPDVQVLMIKYQKIGVRSAGRYYTVLWTK